MKSPSFPFFEFYPAIIKNRPRIAEARKNDLNADVESSGEGVCAYVCMGKVYISIDVSLNLRGLWGEVGVGVAC